MNTTALFYINGKRHLSDGMALFHPLTSFLRDTLRLTGTKVACGEGACGACTVLVGQPDGDDMDYQSFNACLFPLYKAAGCHVVTVEGVTGESFRSPVQEALIAGHGAQCGFCTPGMVMTLSGFCEAHRSPEDLPDVLSGNLCRCTGYLPILESAHQIDLAAYQPLAHRFPERAIRQNLADYRRMPTCIKTDAGRLFIPTTLDEAVQWKHAHPDATIVAGGTELGVAWAEHEEPSRDVVSLSFLMAEAQVRRESGRLVIDAAASWAQVEETAQTDFPELARLLSRFAGPQIKNAGTVGGQIAQASPIGDALPMLAVLGAEVEIVSVDGQRVISIDEFLQSGQHALEPDELISRVFVPQPRLPQQLRLEKVSRRQGFDRSVVSAAMLLTCFEGIIEDVKLAFGGLGPRVLRLPRTEAFLAGRPLTEPTLLRAGDIMQMEISPPSDSRGGAEYRSLLAANLLLRLLDEPEEVA